MNGERPNCISPGIPESGPVSDVKIVYKARPLDGIWATAPFLHNGSVPSLYLLLSTNEERDAAGSFSVGSREFDPEKIGLKTSPGPGLSKFDTTQKGNFNKGHQFKGDYREDKKYPLGVVGPVFDHDQRMAIIEYLKSL